jgi:hypothetical protein
MLLSCAAKKEDTLTHLGAENQIQTEAIALTQAISMEKTGELMKITGLVSSVCQKKGCWMILKDGEQEVRVKFTPYELQMPKDLAGTQVIVEGKLLKRLVPESELRHYAEDAGKSKDEIEMIIGDQEILELEVFAVDIPKKS